MWKVFFFFFWAGTWTRQPEFVFHPFFIYKPQICNVCKTSCFQWFTFKDTKSWKYHQIWHSLDIKNIFIHIYLLIKSNWNGHGDINKNWAIFTFEVNKNKKKTKNKIKFGWENNKRKNNPTTFILYKSASDFKSIFKLRPLSLGCLGQTHMNSKITSKLRLFRVRLSFTNQLIPSPCRHILWAPFLALCRLRYLSTLKRYRRRMAGRRVGHIEAKGMNNNGRSPPSAPSSTVTCHPHSK